MPSILVKLPAPLHRAAGGVGELAAEGETVALALASLRDGHPAVARLFLEECNEPRRGVSLFLNGSDLRSFGGLGTPLKPGDRLAVVLLVSGG
jgi:molybdopterin converting factor small subunit